jgi:two-component system sensor histidine kinase AgrC
VKYKVLKWLQSNYIVIHFFLLFSLVAVVFWVYFNIPFINNKIKSLFILFNLLFCLINVSSSWVFLMFRNKKSSYEYQQLCNKTLSNTNMESQRHKEIFIKRLQSLEQCNTPEELNVMLQKIVLSNQKPLYFPAELKNIRIPTLLGLFTSKLEYLGAYDVNVKISIIGIIEKISKINIFDLCEILGIFCDNAIEAAIESNEKKIEMIISMVDGTLSFTIKNTVLIYPSLENMFENGWTTKGDGRGTGLFIVKSILKRNKHILLNTLIENGWVIQNLVLPES